MHRKLARFEVQFLIGLTWIRVANGCDQLMVTLWNPLRIEEL
jgi:hypothetical protein